MRICQRSGEEKTHLSKKIKYFPALFSCNICIFEKKNKENNGGGTQLKLSRYWKTI